MNQLVFIENGRVVTDSLTVAEKFRKDHKNVMRDIEVQLLKLNEADEVEWGVLNFERTHYQHEQNGQWYPKFDMTEDAFAIVAMSYVTPEAMKMKVKFIQEFKRMREQLQSGVPSLSPNQAMAIALQQTAEMMTKVPVLENRIETIERKVDEQITLEQGEQRRVQIAVSTRIYDLEERSEARGPLFRELYRELKNRWGVSSYRDLLRKDLTDVLAYINAWVPRKA